MSGPRGADRSAPAGRGFVDTHCHLSDTRGAGVDEVVAAARAAGVTTMITVGCDAETTAHAIEMARRFEGVHATAGLHPHEARHGLGTIEPFVRDPAVIAVGECGLDYHYDHSPREVQREVFAGQIHLAMEYNLPLIIHTREAWRDTFDILNGEGYPSRTIFHCFTGSPAEARICLDNGAFLSFSGIVTFNAATDVQDAARFCPIKRMLVETDSPYLAPAPHRGRTNRPEYVVHVVEQLARLRGDTTEGVREATQANARLAFPRLRS